MSEAAHFVFRVSLQIATPDADFHSRNRVIPVACTTNLSSLSRYCSTPLHMFVGALEAPGMQIDTPWPIDMSL